MKHITGLIIMVSAFFSPFPVFAHAADGSLLSHGITHLLFWVGFVLLVIVTLVLMNRSRDHQRKQAEANQTHA